MRPHHAPKYGDKNFQQHKAFLNEVIGMPLHKEIIDWFLTLPLWLDLPGLRVVHACWHQRFMDFLAPKLAPGHRLTSDLMVEASREPDDESVKDDAEPSVFKAVEALTKGIEIPLPKPHSFKDKDGHERSRVRVRWWDQNAVTYKRTAMLLDDEARNKLPGNADTRPRSNRRRRRQSDLHRPLLVDRDARAAIQEGGVRGLQHREGR